MLQKPQVIVPKPNNGIDEIQVVQLCRETFAEEYQKRMVQYNMDLSQEINQMDRARAILKDETVEHRNEILKAINPLHVISRVTSMQSR